MAAERTAEVEWEGDLAHGKGTFTTGSGALGEQEVTWSSRTERSEGRTSPEELLAAAHASCFSMALSHGLAEAGNPPEHLHVSAACTFDAASSGKKVTSMRLAVRGRVPGMDEDGFREAAEAAKDGCPISGALEGNLEITVEASLES